MNITAWTLGVLDRAVRTGMQTLAAYLSTATLITDVAWLPALSATGFAIVLSVITQVIGSPSWGEAPVFQVAERAAKTFLQAVVAGIGTAAMFESVDWATALSSAALAAAYSVVTSVLTLRAGDEEAIGQVDVSVPPDVRDSVGRDAATYRAA
jgi:uncharacterized membrane protein